MRLESNLRDLVNRSGPGFDRWRRAMAASVGASLPSRDELENEAAA